MRTDLSFSDFFKEAVGSPPFPFQQRFAEELPALVHVPTGLGKTAMAVLGWLWRRHGAGEDFRRQTPRRLVYCLPMRVLVEQTRDHAIRWLHNLGCLGGRVTFDPPLGVGRLATPKQRVATYAPSADEPDKVAVYVLMGGEDEDDWYVHPEREAIIIGTQDMLLSRALNRGYAASRSRWPMQFGLLHTDCLWVFDEIQLMGSGLATTAQLEAFRRILPHGEATSARNGHGCRSVWMSATMRKEWLGTVDFKEHLAALRPLKLTSDDEENETAQRCLAAVKPLRRAAARLGDVKDVEGLAAEILEGHGEACEKAGRGTRTIVVVNTVRRACELFKALREPQGGGKGRKSRDTEASAGSTDVRTRGGSKLVLLHSRFRPEDRDRKVQEALGDPPPEGTIIVSTQVIEAGVDIS
ncbi:MAG: DEAD/DEAH box helicase, partial [Planctomycetota bacterium]